MSLTRTLAVVALCLGQSWAQNHLDAAALDSYLQAYVRSGNFSGSVLIEQGGKRVFERAYGSADREKPVRNTERTAFHVASVSMQYTAAAVLRLVDQGSLRLSTRVSEVVPGVTGGDQITILDLLLERSGLPDINTLPEYNAVLTEHQTPASLVARIAGRPLLFEPGSKFLHEEHSAYNLLALIVEKKTGLPFRAAVKKLVFQPAGLGSSFIDDDAVPVIPDVAKGYAPTGVAGLEPAPAIHWSAKTGNASVVTTARDQARWVRAEFGDRFLRTESRQAVLATSPRVGYGWFRGENPRYHETVYYMNGRSPGFASFVLYLPRERMTVIVFSNIYSSATTTIGYALANLALGLPAEPFRPSQTALSAEQLRSCAGIFHFGANFYQPNADVEVRAKGAELEMRWPSGGVSPLIPLGTDRFMDRAYWETVSLERDSAGRPQRLVYGDFQGTVVGGK
jgi:CubicO group peptidase (beta-lactamase class C family)